jgi:type I restriction enzyme S subunit
MSDQTAQLESKAAALPEGWRVVRLDEAYSFTKKPHGLNLHAYSQIPFVPMEMIPGGLEYFERYELRPADSIGSGTYFEPGDILLSKITPSFENGKQGIIENLPTPFGYATTEVIPIKAIPGRGSQLFLFYYLLRHSVRQELAGKMEGTTGRQRLKKSALESLRIPLPPLAEQRAIASTLRAAQAAVQARRRAIELERERKAALMQVLFTKGTRGEATKMTEIGEVPESWEVVRLGEKITLQRGFDLPNSQRMPGPFPVVSSSGITGTHSQAKVKGPGVITGRYGTLGEIHYIEDDYWPLNTTLFVSEFRGNDPLFVSYFLATVNMQSFNDKTSVPGVNRNHVHATTVAFPPIAEQREIAEALRACDEVIAGLEREAELHEELFRALLEELMTGRSRVSV